LSVEIPIEKIVPPKDFLRSESEARRNLGQLAKSIEQVGLIHPIKVAPKDDGYELVAGFRRFLAHKELGLPTIRAEVLKEPVDVIERTRIGLIENIQRQKLIRREMIDAAVLLYKRRYGSYKDVADKLGIDYSFAKELVGLEDAPEELVKMIGRGRGKVGRGKAVEILKAYPDEPEKAVEIAKIYASEGLSSEEKKRLFEVVEENPDRTVDEIKKEISKPPRIRFEFNVALPVAYHERFLKACEERDMEPPDLAKTVLISWIEENVPT